MKIEWNGRDDMGRYSFSAEPEAHDGTPPVRDLLLDRDMLAISDDLLSLAGFLAFAPYCGGSLTLPRPVSAELAEAIGRFQSPTWVHVSEVDFEPRQAPQGDGMALVLEDSLAGAGLPNRWGRPRNVVVSVLDSAQWAGHLVATDRVLVASNAVALSRLVPERMRALPILGAAVLFMESYRCTTLVLPDGMDMDGDTWTRLSGLFKAAKLGLLREQEALDLLALAG